MVKKSYLNKPVKIEWLDHCSWDKSSWHDKEYTIEELTPSRMTSYGVLIKEDDEFVIICAHLSEHDNITGEMCILKRTIMSIKELKVE